MVEDKLIEFFVELDEFYKAFEQKVKKRQLENGFSKIRNRKIIMFEAEIMSILLLFQYGHFTN